MPRTWGSNATLAGGCPNECSSLLLSSNWSTLVAATESSVAVANKATVTQVSSTGVRVLVDALSETRFTNLSIRLA